MRLPPANNEYRIALWMVAGLVDALGIMLSKVRFTSLMVAEMNWDSEKSGADRRRLAMQVCRETKEVSASPLSPKNGVKNVSVK
jgi:hypothetical protein